MAIFATLEGRVTLTDMRLSITEDAEKQERVVNSEDEYYEILKQNFGIEITS